MVLGDKIRSQTQEKLNLQVHVLNEIDDHDLFDEMYQMEQDQEAYKSHFFSKSAEKKKKR